MACLEKADLLLSQSSLIEGWTEDPSQANCVSFLGI